MNLEQQRSEALRLYREWMAQERVCAKYISDKSLNDLETVPVIPQTVWQDYENRVAAELKFREFIKTYPNTW